MGCWKPLPPEFQIQWVWSEVYRICTYNKFLSDYDAAGPHIERH